MVKVLHRSEFEELGSCGLKIVFILNQKIIVRLFIKSKRERFQIIFKILFY